MAMAEGRDPLEVPFPGIYVFPQTGPGIKLAWKAYNELRQKRRLHMITTQVATLPMIRGAHGGTIYRRVNDFTRRVSLACRIFMAAACQMPVDENKIIPKVEQQPGSPIFQLADAKEDKYQYYIYNFDHMYPHFMIEKMIRMAEMNNVGASVDVNRKMLVFRELDSGDDVIEISCTVRITPGDYQNHGGCGDMPCYGHDREYICVMSSTCIRSRIKPPDEGQRYPWYQHLKEICFMADSQLPCEVDDVAHQLSGIVIQNDDDDDDDDAGDN